MKTVLLVTSLVLLVLCGLNITPVMNQEVWGLALFVASFLV